MFKIEIQASNKTWFADAELDAPITAIEADKRIAELRAQGFKARAKMIEDQTCNWIAKRLLYE